MNYLCNSFSHNSTEFPLRPIPGVVEHPYLLLAEWAPRGHGLVMVQDYDIYYRPSPTSHHWYRITKTAVPGVISHGVPDWLYEGKKIILVDGLFVLSLYRLVRLGWGPK